MVLVAEGVILNLLFWKWLFLQIILACLKEH